MEMQVRTNQRAQERRVASQREEKVNRLKSIPLVLIAVTALISGCDRRPEQQAAPPPQPAASASIATAASVSRTRTLAEARRGYATRLTRKESVGEPAPVPPANLFRSVTYTSPVGELAAYVSVAPPDAQKRPAILWLVGGFANSISPLAWHPGKPENDQSATVFRESGIIMMYPSLRGGNDNPGFLECLYGEVDDVLAAAAFLQKQPGVDPQRIYLGGHSTGGTLALLVAEHTNPFRAIFALGPVGSPEGYGPENLPFDTANRAEVNLRSPIRWLDSVRTPTFILEGSDGSRSNISELRTMARANRNPLIHFHPVPRGDHFSIIRPATRLIANKILADDGAAANIRFTDTELAKTMRN
jgi:dipeptidyl aminopeptidase/acylaminoacyl peptidase